ncbi:histidine kinase [Desulfonema ishimotonii]|uniref:histidine kinase n=2 Tax=Desulfonema ishimotonii TaxID=45657 RepID=A0A401G020_9BACT|nr:histidine kinase [Desulfonema ishimotonii]
MRFSILKKFLIAFLLISLPPLFTISFYARQILLQVGQSAVESSRQALLENSASLLEARARGIARQVERLLKLCRDDLSALALVPSDAELYLRFSRGHQRQIWAREGTSGQIREVRKDIPLYREITFVSPEGVESIRILENQIMAGGRHVALPFRGSFGREDYFNQARVLGPGEIYVSHLMGRHIRKSEQLQGAENVEDAVGGATYSGIIRFAAPVFRNGVPAGVVSLALDHRHLMEYTQHVLPIGNREVVFPSYTGGNYAFLFDDDGWIITHPKFWDIRGYDRDTGRVISPESPDYNESAMKAGQIPFNLFHVPFIHENYRHVASEALAGRSGVTTTANVGDVPRVMAYAPIRFHLGEYEKTGFFGGITLGARTEKFHHAVDKTASEIRYMLNRAVRHFVFIIFGTAVLVGGIAILLARSISRPILMLNKKVKAIGAGHFDGSVEIHSGDELESLGRNFQKMAAHLEENRQELVSSLRKLGVSRQEAVKERDFIRNVFANVISGLMVIDPDGTITSINQNIEDILGVYSQDTEGCGVETAFADYPEILSHIRAATKTEKRVSADLEIRPFGPRRYIELNVSHLGDARHPEGRSLLVIIRDITRRKKMESYLSRSDRLVSLGTLAAGVAHEIRNPLTGISLMLDDLHDRMTHSQGDQRLMQRALEEIEKLENIITELLDFAAKPSANCVMTDLKTVIENTLFLVKKQCKRQNVLLFQEIPEPLPRIRMDPEKMKQALLNIMLNALNVMPDGGELHVIVIIEDNLEMFTGRQGIEIRICDTGPGVNPEDMDYIFDPFFTRTPKGSGLGLSITHTIIEEQRGKIVVDSKLGRGACFKIFFPIKNGEDEDGKDSGC